MSLLTLEHSKWAYKADFAVYAIAVVVFAGVLLVADTRRQLPVTIALGIAGLVSWTLIEYLMHRFILHGMQPFRGWHEKHHTRPMALISAPTLFSASLIAVLVFLPAVEWGGLMRGGSFTVGVMAGYLVYSVTHHATHHWRAGHGWLKKRKLWHALHHRAGRTACYGVTTAFWDHVFGSARRSGAQP